MAGMRGSFSRVFGIWKPGLFSMFWIFCQGFYGQKMVFWLCFQVGVFSSWGKVLFLDFFHFVVKNVIARNAKNYGELHDEAISDCNSQALIS